MNRRQVIVSRAREALIWSPACFLLPHGRAFRRDNVEREQGDQRRIPDVPRRTLALAATAPCGMCTSDSEGVSVHSTLPLQLK